MSIRGLVYVFVNFVIVSLQCFLIVSPLLFISYLACLQCYDTVGWAAGRASGL